MPKSILDPAEFPLLREAGGSFTQDLSSVEEPTGAARRPEMSSLLLRHSREDDHQRSGKANGPFTIYGEFKLQLLACTIAILTRFLPYITAIGPAFIMEAKLH